MRLWEVNEEKEYYEVVVLGHEFIQTLMDIFAPILRKTGYLKRKQKLYPKRIRVLIEKEKSRSLKGTRRREFD